MEALLIQMSLKKLGELSEVYNTPAPKKNDSNE